MIAKLAVRQHGVVSRAQLLREGVPGHCIDERVSNGRLRNLHGGVYQVGPVAVPRAPLAAAVLACGGCLGAEGESMAAISHTTGGLLMEVVPPSLASGPLELTVQGSERPRKPGLRVHRVRKFAADELTTVDSIPVTTRARTLLDLSGLLSPRQLERAIARADRAEPGLRDRLRELLLRYPGRRGTRRLRPFVQEDSILSLTRSEAEERLLGLIRKAAIRQPELNVVIEGVEVDFLWRRERLIVEVDGFAFHSSRRAFEHDHRRDHDLVMAGYRVMRVTWRQIVREPEALVVRLALSLARGSGPTES